MAKNSLKSIRKRVLKQRGVELAKLTRKPVTHDDLPSVYPKTKLMRYVELKFHSRLEDIIFSDTIYALEHKLHVDATTISKWRKTISDAKDKVFFDQFK